jgi:DNA-directed RNA polymerase subunit H (RpoH/RPB5)
MVKAKPKVRKHILIPKHAKLSDAEKKQLFTRYNITSKELPKILLTDPALTELNVKPGDVVKITRDSPTTGTTVFYRGVMHA